MIIIDKDNNEYTCAVNCSDDANILFLDLSQISDPIPTKADVVVMFIPFTRDAHDHRAGAKRFRFSYMDKETFLIDVDETFLTQKRLRLKLNEPTPIEELVVDFLARQNYLIKSEKI